MESVCVCIIATAFVMSPVLGHVQIYQDNVLYASEFGSHKWKLNDEYVKVNISVNMRTAVREVNSRFVSITLDSSLVDKHWAHLDFR